MKEHPNYETGGRCEFRADGKLRGGKILKSLPDNDYLVGYYRPSYREITISKDKVKKL